MQYTVKHDDDGDLFSVVDETGRTFQRGMRFQDARDLAIYLYSGPPEQAHPSGWRLYDADLQPRGRPKAECYSFFALDHAAAIAYARRCASDLEAVLDRPVVAVNVRVARPLVAAL